MFHSTSSEIVKHIEMLSRRADADALSELLAAAAKAKPGDEVVSYDVHYQAVHDLYDGKQIKILIAELQRRYKQNWPSMDPFAVNIIRHHAELSAQVYRQPVDRFIELRDGDVWVRPGSFVDVDGVPTLIDVGQEQQDEFGAMLEGAKIRPFMIEREKRARAGQSIFIRGRWANEGSGDTTSDRPEARADLGREAHLELRSWWPADVAVIPHADLTGELWAANALIARIRGAAPSGLGWRQVWTRREPLGELFVQEMREDGKESSGEPRPYGDNRLPWVALHNGDPEGSLFLDRDRYLVNAQIAINERLTDWLFSAKHSAHGERWAAGRGTQSMKGKTVAGGVNKFHLFGEDVTVGVLDLPFDLTAIDGVEALLKMIGFTLRHRPDDWSTKPGNPPTGVSREIGNIPANERRDEHVEIHRQFEQVELLPMMIRVHDMFSGRTEIGPDVRPRITVPPPRRFLDPTQQADLAIKQNAAGWISDAEAAVRGGGRSSVEEAEAFGLSSLATDAEQPESAPEAAQEPPEAEAEPAPEPAEMDAG